MRILVGGVTGEIQYAQGILNLGALKMREGDDTHVETGTTGMYARDEILQDFFRRQEFNALMMLDLDMLHQGDLIERLRTDMEEKHLDMVTAHYFRRETKPMLSVVSDLSADGRWPYPPMLHIPAEGLHEKASTGFGCVLFSRRVVEEVQASLPHSDSAFYNGFWPGIPGMLGADFRFFEIARNKLGYKLWLDAGLESKHGQVVWLDRELYERLGDEKHNQETIAHYWKKRGELYGMDMTALQAHAQELRGEIEKIDEEGRKCGLAIQEAQERAQQLRDKRIELMGRLGEIKNFIEIERRASLPEGAQVIGTVPILSDEPSQ